MAEACFKFVNLPHEAISLSNKPLYITFEGATRELDYPLTWDKGEEWAVRSFSHRSFQSPNIDFISQHPTRDPVAI